MKKVVSILLICISMFFMTGCSIKKTSEVTDEEKFAMEYDVTVDNPFSYIEYDNLLEAFNSNKAIIYFGSSNDENSQTISKFLTENLIDSEIKEIYYFDPTRLEKKEAKELVKLLNSKLNSSIKNITIPSLYIIKEKQVIPIIEELDHKEIENQNDLSTDEKEQIMKRYKELLKD